MENAKMRHRELHQISERSPSAKRELMEMLDSERGRDQLGKALQEMRGLIHKAELEEKDAASLEKLLDGVETTSLNYLESVIAFYVSVDLQKIMGDAGVVAWRQQHLEKDARRHRAHNAFMDAMRILVRNAMRFEVEGAEKYRGYMVDSEAGDTKERRWLGKLGVIHAFNQALETVLEDV